MTTRFYIFAYVLILGLSTGAKAASCTELNQLWKEKYHAELGAEWAITPFACPSSLGKLAEATHILNDSAFKPGADGTTPDFYQWVTSIITKTVYQPKHDTYDYAAASSKGGTMWIHDAYFSQGVEWRTGALVHEARHSQDDDPRHEICEHGDSKGKMSCDDKFNGGLKVGSGYNYQFNFFWWIRDGASQTDLSKNLAHAQLKSLLLNRFNEITNEDVRKFIR